jgi:L-lactate utilization protein LutB
MKEVGMSGICTILAETRKVIIILGRKSEGNGQLRRHTLRQHVTIELITKKGRKCRC